VRHLLLQRRRRPRSGPEQQCERGVAGPQDLDAEQGHSPAPLARQAAGDEAGVLVAGGVQGR
jgi:hypothetical protein